jgi:hypothetical protein
MLSAIEPIEPSSDFKTRFWQRVQEHEELEKRLWDRLIDLWRDNFYFVRPAVALSSLILVSFLGTITALKLIPQNAFDQKYKSPIMQWTKTTLRDLKTGGFSL